MEFWITGRNIQSLFRILPQHTVALRCAKSLELPQNGFLRRNQTYETGVLSRKEGENATMSTN